MRVSEKEAGSEAASLTKLTQHVARLQKDLDGTRSAQAALMGALQTAANADAAAAELRGELDVAKGRAAAERTALAEKGARLEEAIGRVRSELMSNAEQVGQELRQRMHEIKAVDAQERSNATVAAEAAQQLMEQLAQLHEELRQAEADQRSEAADRRVAEAEASQSREELRAALVAQQESQATEHAIEIGELKKELGKSFKATSCLPSRLPCRLKNAVRALVVCRGAHACGACPQGHARFRARADKPARGCRQRSSGCERRVFGRPAEPAGADR